MSKSVTIPSNMNPWVCEINGVTYSYKAGTTQTVPDEVAELIGIINNAEPKEAPAPTDGYVWTAQGGNIADWEAVPEAPQYTLPAATASALGGVKQGAYVADAAGDAPTAVEFKALLDSLRTAGIISSTAPTE